MQNGRAIIIAACIIAGALALSTGMLTYCSPYQTCVRGEYNNGRSDSNEMRCAMALAPRPA